MSTRARRRFVAVIGLGQFGAELARTLAQRCEVLAIDREDALVDAIADHVQSARALDVRDFDSLAQVLGSSFDEVIITMTENLESSVLATLHSRRLGLQRIRAKALSDDHAAVLRAVGATDVIFPERETAERLAAQIHHPNLLDFIPVAAGYSVVDVVPPAKFVGATLAELELRRRSGVLAIAIRRAAGQFHFLPGPDYRIQAGEILVVIGRDEDLGKLEQAGAARPGPSAPADAAVPTPVVPAPPAAGAAATALAGKLSAAAEAGGTPGAKRTPARKKAKGKKTAKRKQAKGTKKKR